MGGSLLSSSIKFPKVEIVTFEQRLPLEGKLSTKSTDEVAIAKQVTAKHLIRRCAPPSPLGEGSDEQVIELSVNQITNERGRSPSQKPPS
jgi:hypothetical protein